MHIKAYTCDTARRICSHQNKSSVRDLTRTHAHARTRAHTRTKQVPTVSNGPVLINPSDGEATFHEYHDSVDGGKVFTRQASYMIHAPVIHRRGAPLVRAACYTPATSRSKVTWVSSGGTQFTSTYQACLCLCSMILPGTACHTYYCNRSQWWGRYSVVTVLSQPSALPICLV